MSADEGEVAAALPNYELGGELGRGGWGVVLAGRHRQLGRQVAIKQLPPALAADETIRARFIVEAQLLASLDHLHIVPVYDYVERDGLCLLVMEMLPGGTVWSRFTTEGVTPSAAVAITLACLAGLQAAHANNFLHRDIKPENLMFSGNGVVKVTDFGIAKMVGGDHTVATQAGEVIGTPAYIAPEQARGGALSPATDIYAVATMLYELLAGDLPFHDDGDAMSLLFKHAFEAPVPLAEKAPQVPAPIAAVVMSALATDPAERPASAELFGVALARAATEAWGPGWLAHQAIPVMGASSFVSATENPAATEHPADGSAPKPAPVTSLAPPSYQAPPPPMPAVVAPVTSRPGGASFAEMSEPVADLVPLKDVVILPPSPIPVYVGGALLAALACVLALIGFGTPTHGGTITRGSIHIDGAVPPAVGRMTIDTSQPLFITLAPGAPAAGRVQMELSVLGRQVISAQGLLPVQGVRRTEVSLGGHYLLGGAFTATVTLIRDNKVVGRYSFPMRTSQSAFESVSGVAPFVLMLFLLAFALSLLRAMRRGRRSIAGTSGLTILGTLLGADLVAVAWVLVATAPTVAALVVCAVIGAGIGVPDGSRRRPHRRRRQFHRVRSHHLALRHRHNRPESAAPDPSS